MGLQSIVGVLCLAGYAMTMQIEDPSVERRAPAMGFMGMRGKKNIIYDSKRAPSMGFAAMRGKKNTLVDIQDLYPDYRQEPALEPGDLISKKFDYTRENLVNDDVMWPMDNFDKKSPFDGFLDARGKKMPQNSGFFGMRGKKGPSGFVGMRGKKGPASGFMGVRGKKSNSHAFDSLLTLLSGCLQNESLPYTGEDDSDGRAVPAGQ